MRMLGALLLALVLTGQSAASAGFSFPRDDGAHRDASHEWWRALAHVRTASGRRFDIAATFFRFAVAGARDESSAWTTRALLPASVAIIDDEARRAHTLHATQREALGLAHVRNGALDVAVGRLTLRARARRVDLHVEAPGARADLSAAIVSAPVALGDHAYAYPHLDVRGSVQVDGQTFSVHGRAWLDHDFGADQLAGGAVGWDRFVVQFDDGRALVLERRRDIAGRTLASSFGLLVDRAGRSTPFRRRDFFIENPLQTQWTSERTHASYPIIWEIVVRGHDLDLAVIPPFHDQEIVAAGQGSSFYDGAITVERATLPEHTDRGRGFVEMTGYAEPLNF